MDKDELTIGMISLIMLCVIAISAGTVAFSDSGSDGGSDPDPGYFVPDDDTLRKIGIYGGTIRLDSGSTHTVDMRKDIRENYIVDGASKSVVTCRHFSELSVKDDMLIIDRHVKYTEYSVRPNMDYTYTTVIPLKSVISYEIGAVGQQYAPIL